MLLEDGNRFITDVYLHSSVTVFPFRPVLKISLEQVVKRYYRSDAIRSISIWLLWRGTVFSYDAPYLFTL